MQVDNWRIPEDLYYDWGDYWIKVTGNQAVIGMTEAGQSNIGDILYLDLVSEGTVVLRGEKVGSIESGKWVGSLKAPLSGVVVEVNRQLEEDPRQVNTDAYGQGWMFRMELTDVGEISKLMDPRAYKAWTEEQMCLAKEGEMSS
ncbi:MAG TPA: glycine cleavage system protein GcvH [Syntrophomonadaceae bacterium]|nr:glycine cleavage system protein GcvH [Syntrophomonadaceae bacterium]